ncbi:MAG: GNAT family N-acetyltransferase, partial [Anaerolineales bacterium]|nr:GNAT family N-acetyltransferase [Anaerolineales bacterium]
MKFQLHAFANPDSGERDEYVGGWTRDLMRGKHPNFKPGDFLVVEDTKTNAIVSSTCLISQTWRYDEILFGVGRIEIVATDAAYRRRGLIREQFRVLHEWSAARGELAQAITGIPYYYRQFGYEFALNLSPARHTFVPQQIPELKKGEREPYRLRRATRKDLPFVLEVYQHGARRSLVHCERNVALLEYQQFFETDKFNGHRARWCVVESRAGERVGALMHRLFVFQGRVNCDFYDLLPGVSWQEVTPSVLRGLAQIASKLELSDKKPFTQLGWYTDDNHPFVELFPETSRPAYAPYAWYLRVPDLPAFLTRLAPVLEKRLAASSLAGYTG